jgi:hypothetical protein
MPRATPERSVTLHMLPQDVAANTAKGYFRNYLVKARHGNEGQHGRKRVFVTYAYLLVLRDLMIRGALPQGAVTQVPMTVQAPSRAGPDIQAAHQILGELTVGGRHIYSLLGLTQPERRAIVYLTSAVSAIDKKFNFVDNFLERAGRPNYVALAQSIVDGRLLDQGLIFRNTVGVFRAAAQVARAQIPGDPSPGYAGCKDAMLDIVDDHIAVFDGLFASSARFTNTTVQQIMDMIEAKGFV